MDATLDAGRIHAYPVAVTLVPKAVWWQIGTWDPATTFGAIAVLVSAVTLGVVWWYSRRSDQYVRESDEEAVYRCLVTLDGVLKLIDVQADRLEKRECSWTDIAWESDGLWLERSLDRALALVELESRVVATIIGIRARLLNFAKAPYTTLPAPEIPWWKAFRAQVTTSLATSETLVKAAEARRPQRRRRWKPQLGSGEEVGSNQ